MCGRATYKLTWEEIVALYRLKLGQPAVNTRARYNVCPTITIDTILDQDAKRRLEQMRWGLIPSWWSKPLKEMKLATFNARAETVATKPMFRSAFKRNRCLIPVSGYYEWQDTPGGKQPWYFTARDGSPALTIAGIWDEWLDMEADRSRKSCTMIITAACSRPRGGGSSSMKMVAGPESGCGVSNRRKATGRAKGLALRKHQIRPIYAELQ
jgi:putative SOS response-associated peptidase YedK